MRKQSEVDLYARLRAACVGVNVVAQPGRATIERVSAELGLHEKETERFLEKWSGRDWWDWGVSVWGGWFTPDAPDRLTR